MSPPQNPAKVYSILTSPEQIPSDCVTNRLEFCVCVWLELVGFSYFLPFLMDENDWHISAAISRDSEPLQVWARRLHGPHLNRIPPVIVARPVDSPQRHSDYL